MTAGVSVNVCSEAVCQTQLTKLVILSKSEQLSAIELRHHSEWSGVCTIREHKELLQTPGIGGDDLLRDDSSASPFRAQLSGTHAELHRRLRGIVN